MPFESKAQSRYMFSQHPKMAKEWAKKTDYSKIPEKLHVGCDVKPTVETQVVEDDTLMGRLAKRMSARDYIDNMNLGTNPAKAAKAHIADMGIPEKISIVGPALKEGAKVEEEHKNTFEKLKRKIPPEKKFFEDIAKDHLSESPKYYKELKKMEKKL